MHEYSQINHCNASNQKYLSFYFFELEIESVFHYFIFIFCLIFYVFYSFMLIVTITFGLFEYIFLSLHLGSQPQGLILITYNPIITLTDFSLGEYFHISLIDSFFLLHFSINFSLAQYYSPVFGQQMFIFKGEKLEQINIHLIQPSITNCILAGNAFLHSIFVSLSLMLQFYYLFIEQFFDIFQINNRFGLIQYYFYQSLLFFLEIQRHLHLLSRTYEQHPIVQGFRLLSYSDQDFGFRVFFLEKCKQFFANRQADQWIFSFSSTQHHLFDQIQEDFFISYLVYLSKRIPPLFWCGLWKDSYQTSINSKFFAYQYKIIIHTVSHNSQRTFIQIYFFVYMLYHQNQKSSMGIIFIMFIKLRYNRSVYLIKSDRISKFQQLVEIVEKNFANLPTYYAFTYKNEDDESILIQNLQNFNSYRKGMAHFDQITINQSQIPALNVRIIQQSREKIHRQLSKKKQKEQKEIRKDVQNEKQIMNHFKQQKKILKKQLHNLSQKLDSPPKEDSLINLFYKDLLKIDERKSLNNKLAEAQHQDKIASLTSILFISNEEAQKLLAKYSNYSIEGIVNNYYQQNS